MNLASKKAMLNRKLQMEQMEAVYSSFHSKEELVVCLYQSRKVVPQGNNRLLLIQIHQFRELLKLKLLIKVTHKISHPPQGHLLSLTMGQLWQKLTSLLLIMRLQEAVKMNQISSKEIRS